MRRSGAAVLWTVAILAASPTAALAQRASRWQTSGPPFAGVLSIDVAHDAAGTVYASASDLASLQSAVFRSADSGNSWELVMDALPGDTAWSIQADPHQPRRLFASTFRYTAGANAASVYVSVDAGVSWQTRYDSPTSCGGQFAFDTMHEGVIYVAFRCSGQLVASLDGGSTWVTRTSPSPAIFGVQTDTQGFLYGLAADGIFRSSDGGVSWSSLVGPVFGAPISALAIDPTDARVLLVGTADYASFFNHGGIARSEDGGETWTTTLYDRVVTDLNVDPSEPSRIYASAASVGGLNGVPGGVFASQDGGQTWRDLQIPGWSAYRLTLSGTGGRLYAASLVTGVYELQIRKTREGEAR